MNLSGRLKRLGRRYHLLVRWDAINYLRHLYKMSHRGCRRLQPPSKGPHVTVCTERNPVLDGLVGWEFPFTLHWPPQTNGNCWWFPVDCPKLDGFPKLAPLHLAVGYERANNMDNKHVLVGDILKAAKRLCEPGDEALNPEYARGLCELIGDLTLGGSEDSRKNVCGMLGWDFEKVYSDKGRRALEGFCDAFEGADYVPDEFEGPYRLACEALGQRPVGEFTPEQEEWYKQFLRTSAIVYGLGEEDFFQDDILESYYPSDPSEAAIRDAEKFGLTPIP